LGTTTSADHLDNRLLAGLPPQAFASLASDLRLISIEPGVILFEPGSPVDAIYFPQTGVISLLILTKDGRAIEASSIGREGAIGLHSGLGARRSFTRAIARIGGRFSTITPSRFAQVIERSPSIADFMSRYNELLWTQAQQNAACNALHSTSSRLSRRLMELADRTDGKHLFLKQEYLAQMLGVRRTTVTLLAQSMQDKGMIKYRRGQIKILDRKRLKACACECYDVMRREGSRLLDAQS
jgi:CRP-like cAMP-binding protein